MYSRDLSKKVRSAKKNLVERGVNINPVAPYGYRKDPADKHKLIIDTEASSVIVRIFQSFADGASSREIAVKLNQENIPTPSAKKVGTPSFNKAWSAENFWSGRIIACILRDRQYTGCYVWGKTVHKEIGVHRYTRIAPDEWYIIENDHEAIISQELFDRVQARLGIYRQPAKHIKKPNPLSRKVYCGICGRVIMRKGKTNIYYRCDTPNFIPDKGCSSDKVFLDDLQEAIVTAIRVQARYAVEIQSILDMRRKQERKCIDICKRSFKILHR